MAEENKETTEQLIYHALLRPDDDFLTEVSNIPGDKVLSFSFMEMYNESVINCATRLIKAQEDYIKLFRKRYPPVKCALMDKNNGLYDIRLSYDKEKNRPIIPAYLLSNFRLAVLCRIIDEDGEKFEDYLPIGRDDKPIAPEGYVIEDEYQRFEIIDDDIIEVKDDNRFSLEGLGLYSKKWLKYYKKNRIGMGGDRARDIVALSQTQMETQKKSSEGDIEPESLIG